MNRFKNVRVKISYLTGEMTIGRNTIVTLYMKGHSNSSIARSYILAVKRFARWHPQICNRPGQGRKQTIRTKIESQTCDENRT